MGRNLLNPGPGGTALSGNAAINGNPWGLASFAPWGGGARGSSGPVGQEEGTMFAWGLLGPREERVQFSPPQNAFNACLFTAANQSSS